jgi:hypothetical protein
MAKHVRITVRPTGERNPSSQGSEIWVLRAGAANKPATEVFTPTEGWQARDGSLVAIGQAEPLQANIDTDQIDAIEVLHHAWSGKVEIIFEGRSETIDLYAPTNARKRIAIPGAKAAKALARGSRKKSRGGLIVFVVLLLALGVGLAAWWATGPGRSVIGLG